MALKMVFSVQRSKTEKRHKEIEMNREREESEARQRYGEYLHQDKAHNEGVLHQSRLSAEVEAEEYNLVSLLKPSVTIDGNQWCVLWGDDLVTGIAGFGDTPYKAVLDFNKNWNRPVPKRKAPPNNA